MRAEGAQEMIRLVCSPPSGVSLASRHGGERHAWRWPAGRRLAVLRSLLRLAWVNSTEAPGGAASAGCVNMSAVAAALRECAAAAEEVGVGDAVVEEVLEAVTALLPSLEPPHLCRESDNGCRGGPRVDSVDSSMSVPLCMAMARSLDSVEILAKVCERDAAVVGVQVQRRQSSGKAGGAVALVAGISTLLNAWCSRGQTHGTSRDVVDAAGGGPKGAVKCRTALLLLKACAAGGAGGRSASLASEQLAVLSSMGALASWQQGHKARRDAAAAAAAPGVVELFLAALAASCRTPHMRSDADASRHGDCPGLFAIKLPAPALPLPCGGNETDAGQGRDAWERGGEAEEEVWQAALQQWKRSYALGEIGPRQPQTLIALARVLRTAALLSPPARARWQIGAVAELCSCAVAVMTPSLQSRDASTSAGSESPGRAAYSRLACALLVAVERCARGLDARTGLVAIALSTFFVQGNGA